MNKFIFNFAVVLLLTACHSEKRPADISGTWHWNDEDTGADFTLTLTQNDRELTGFYCGIYNH